MEAARQQGPSIRLFPKYLNNSSGETINIMYLPVNYTTTLGGIDGFWDRFSEIFAYTPIYFSLKRLISGIRDQQTLEAQRTNYYFYATTLRYLYEFESRNLNSENLTRLHAEISKVPQLEKINQAIIQLQADRSRVEVKWKKKRRASSEITVFYDNSNQKYQYYISTPLLICKPHERSYVKLVLPIVVERNQWQIRFDDYYVMKVSKVNQDKRKGELIFPSVTACQRLRQRHVCKNYMISKLFPGLPLDKFIKDKISEDEDRYYREGMTFFDMKNLFIAMSQSVSELHCRAGFFAKKYVHTDIKPHNMVLDIYHGKILLRLIDPEGIHEAGKLLDVSSGTKAYNYKRDNKSNEIRQMHWDIYALAWSFFDVFTGMSRLKQKPFIVEQEIKNMFQDWNENFWIKEMKMNNEDFTRALLTLLLDMWNQDNPLNIQTVIARLQTLPIIREESRYQYTETISILPAPMPNIIYQTSSPLVEVGNIQHAVPGREREPLIRSYDRGPEKDDQSCQCCTIS